MPNDVQTAAADPSTATPSPIDLATFTREERQTWRDTGKLPGEPQADSTPAKDQKEASDATAKGAETSPASEPEKTQEQAKGKGAEARIRQLVAEKKALEERLAAREKGEAKTETKESPKQEPEKTVQPAKLEAPAKPVRPDPADPKFKNWDEYETAQKKYDSEHDEYLEKLTDFKAKQAVEADRQSRAQEQALGELKTKIEDAKTRYADFEERIGPTAKKLEAEPSVVAALVGDSPVWADLLYTLAGDAELDNLLEMAKTQPGAAIRKVVLLEKLVTEELAKGGKGKAEAKPEKEESASSKTEDAPAKPAPTRQPKPTSEVGGRGTDTEDAGVAAARSGDMRTAKTVWDRQYAERHK